MVPQGQVCIGLFFHGVLRVHQVLPKSKGQLGLQISVPTSRVCVNVCTCGRSYVCVGMSMCECVCMNMCTCVCEHSYVCVNMGMCECVCEYVYMCVWAFLYMCGYGYECVCVYEYVYVCEYIYVCLSVHVSVCESFRWISEHGLPGAQKTTCLRNPPDTVILCKLTRPFPLLFPWSATKQQAFQYVLLWIQDCTDFLENFNPEIRLADGQHTNPCCPWTSYVQLLLGILLMSKQRCFKDTPGGRPSCLADEKVWGLRALI